MARLQVVGGGGGGTASRYSYEEVTVNIPNKQSRKRTRGGHPAWGFRQIANNTSPNNKHRVTNAKALKNWTDCSERTYETENGREVWNVERNELCSSGFVEKAVRQFEKLHTV
jgi:hypothetical protein